MPPGNVVGGLTHLSRTSFRFDHGTPPIAKPIFAPANKFPPANAMIRRRF
jgi:hypothetical protein